MQQFDVAKRIVTSLPELAGIAEPVSGTAEPHTYQDVELAIIKAHFAVAENGAVLAEKGVLLAQSSYLLSAAVIGFTVITIIFTPLSFFSSLFALPIDRFERNLQERHANASKTF